MRRRLATAAYSVANLAFGLADRVDALRGSHPVSSAPLTGSVDMRVTRAADLTPLANVRIRLAMARAHRWRTRWAAFDWYVTAEVDGRTVTMAGIVDRQGAVGGMPARLGLLGGVVMAPQYRRYGLGGEVVRRSTDLIARELRCDFGVLMCSPHLVPFYGRLGWKHVPNALRFVRFGEPGEHTGPVMVYEAGERSLPAGPIDVKGLPA
jgi:GNAT superfamily N-acetyltransferase